MGKTHHWRFRGGQDFFDPQIVLSAGKGNFLDQKSRSVLDSWADLCEQEGSGGVAEDRANNVQETRVNTSLA